MTTGNVFAILQSPDNTDKVETTQAWWNGRTSGLIGAGVGILGGIFGTGIGICSNIRKTRSVANILLLIMPILGIACIPVALFALILRQPFHVWYPLLLPGLLFTVLGFAFGPMVKKRWNDEDLRKIQTMDA